MKSPFKSKTIIFNTLTVLVVLATFYGYVPDQQLANLVSNVLLALSPLFNILIRYMTKESIKPIM